MKDRQHSQSCGCTHLLALKNRQIRIEIGEVRAACKKYNGNWSSNSRNMQCAPVGETVSSGQYSDSLHTPKPKCLSSPCEVPIRVGRGILGKLIPEVSKFSIRSFNQGFMIHENFQIRGGVGCGDLADCYAFIRPCGMEI